MTQKVSAFFLILMLLSRLCLAQQPIIFNGQPELEKGVDISANVLFFEDRSDKPMPLEEIKKQKFVPLSREMMQLAVPDRSLIVNWLKFNVKNTHPTDTLNLIFFCNPHPEIDLYSEKHFKSPENKAGIADKIEIRGFDLKIMLPPGQTNTYWVQMTDLLHYIAPLKAELHTPFSFLAMDSLEGKNSSYLFITISMFIGCLFFMSIYAAYQYLLSRDIAFAYYTIYLFASFLTLFSLFDVRFDLRIIQPIIENKFNIPSSSFIPIFHTLFVISVLEIPRIYPRKWVIMQVLLGLIVLETIVEFYENYAGGYVFSSNVYYLYIQGLPNVLNTIYLIYLIVISKSPLKKFLLTGVLSLFLLIFLLYILIPILLGYTVTDIPPQLNSFLNFFPSFMMLGIFIEAVCFAFALAYRGKLVQDEKIQLQTDYASKLETALGQRTLEIREQNSLLETQKMRQIEIAFEKKLAETEMTALRAQMNPHFIFNCLNSIKLYTLENDSQTASAYLTTFSKLIRLVLENSRSEKVTLEKEIETLRLYIELEVMRFKDKVDYEIFIDAEVDLLYIEVPPLLLQPYIENAIWHGLMHKEFGGKVLIDISQPEEHLLHIEITDNGIGRKQAAEYKSKSIIKHKSFGLNMTTERLQVINQLYDIQTSVEIIDLTDSFGKATGTKVIIDIPI